MAPSKLAVQKAQLSRPPMTNRPGVSVLCASTRCSNHVKDHSSRLRRLENGEKHSQVQYEKATPEFSTEKPGSLVRYVLCKDHTLYRFLGRELLGSAQVERRCFWIMCKLYNCLKLGS
jgi:hypothetical protein